jgi:hypothetical protein
MSLPTGNSFNDEASDALVSERKRIGGEEVSGTPGLFVPYARSDDYIEYTLGLSLGVVTSPVWATIPNTVGKRVTSPGAGARTYMHLKL